MIVQPEEVEMNTRAALPQLPGTGNLFLDSASQIDPDVIECGQRKLEGKVKLSALKEMYILAYRLAALWIVLLTQNGSV